MAVNTTFQNITLRVGNIQGDRNVYVYAKQYDAASRYLLVDLRDDNGRVEVGGTPQLNAIKPDGTFSYTAGSIEETGLMLFELSSQVLAVPGKVECDISVFGSETELIDLFRGDGINSVFHLHYVFSEITSVKIAGTETSDYTFDSTNQTITFTTVPAVTSSIIVEGTGKSLLTSSTFFVIVSRSAYNPEAIESSDEFTTLSEAIEAANACIAKEVIREANEAQRILNEEGRVAAEAAREAKWGSATATATSIPAAQDASVSVTQDSSGTHFGFGIPTGNGIASITKTGTSGNVDTYTITFTNGTTQTYEVTNGASTVKVGGVVQSEINFDSDPQEQLDQKANVDGYYETLGAGTADQLISPDGVTDTPETDAEYNPFVFRPTGGSTSVSSGNAKIDQIRGSSIVWNQKIYNGDFASSIGWRIIYATYTISDGIASVTATTKNGRLLKASSFSFPDDHILLFSADVKTTSNLVGLGFGSAFYKGHSGSGKFERLFYLAKKNNTRYNDPSIVDHRASDWDEFQVKNVNLFDLTQMFGTTIADQIYTMETATAGSGVAYFRSIFPLSYYKYDPGTIKNVTASALRTVEFNQWDEEWEVGSLTSGIPTPSSSHIRSKNFCKMLPGVTYYQTHHSGDIIWIAQYDADKAFIKYHTWSGSNNAGSFISDDRCAYFKFVMKVSYGTTYNNDICLNLSHSGYRDGEYESYKTHELSLPISTYFPDGMNGVDTVYDEINFKTRKAIKRFGIVDLGTLSWNYIESGTSGTPFFNPTVAPVNGKLGIRHMICTKYPCIYGTRSALVDKSVASFNDVESGQITIRDTDYTDAVSFKAAMSGVYLIYELATPIETDIPESVNNTYIESDFGTEEFVYSETDIPIKVPCEIKYIDNLVDKLRNLNPMTTSELNEVLTILD